MKTKNSFINKLKVISIKKYNQETDNTCIKYTNIKKLFVYNLKYKITEGKTKQVLYTTFWDTGPGHGNDCTL